MRSSLRCTALALVLTLAMLPLLFSLPVLQLGGGGSGALKYTTHRYRKEIRHANANAQQSAALGYAAANADVYLARLLLEHGAVADASLALPNAARAGCVSLCRLLLEHGARRHLDDALIAAAIGVDVDDERDLSMRCWFGDNNHFSDVDVERLETVRVLLAAGARADADDSRALVEAARKGRYEIVRALLAEGAMGDAQESLALVEAARKGHNAAAAALLTYEHPAGPPPPAPRRDHLARDAAE
jgi:hypothetical protein